MRDFAFAGRPTPTFDEMKVKLADAALLQEFWRRAGERRRRTFQPWGEPGPRTVQLDLGKHCFRVEFFGRARDERERAGMPPFMFRSTLLGALVEAKAGGWVTDLHTGQILPA